MSLSISKVKSVRNYLIIPNSSNWIVCVIIWIAVFISCNESVALKRNASPDINSDNSESALDKINVNYDEYPMVVPKRAAMLLDRIMVALHHALEDNDREGIQRITDLHKSSRHSGNNARYDKGAMQQFKGAGTENGLTFYELPIESNGEISENEINGHSDETMMELQRRGHGESLGPNKNRVYWRCYFNAVTCF